MTDVYPAHRTVIDEALSQLEGANGRSATVARDYLQDVQRADYDPASIMAARLGLWTELRTAIAHMAGAVRRQAVGRLLVAYNAVQHGRRRWVIRVRRCGTPHPGHMRRVVWDGECPPRVHQRVERRRLRAVAGYRG